MLTQFFTYYGIHCVTNSMFYLFDRTIEYYTNKYHRSSTVICAKNNTFNRDIEERHIAQQVSAEKFDQAVKLFKQRFDLKSIRRMFSMAGTNEIGTNDYNHCWSSQKARLILLDIFYANPIISTYLSRDRVENKGCELCLESKYENSFYKASLRYNEEMIPYRTLYSTPNVVNLTHKADKNLLEPKTFFYESGSLDIGSKPNFIIEKQKIDHALSKRICFSLEGDIYGVAEKITTIQKELKKNEVIEADATSQYFVWPGAKDGHFYLTAVIFDVDGNPICSLLINSERSERYSHILKEKFKINNKTTPFIDCSIDIQIHEKDLNCGIYGSIIGRAFIELFHNESEESDKVFKTYKEDKIEQKVQEFVRNKIVSYLPEYFYKDEDKGFQRKSEEELVDFHMQRRWDIGNQFIKQRSEEAKKRSWIFSSPYLPQSVLTFLTRFIIRLCYFIFCLERKIYSFF